jgi:hypothetical protein
MKKWNVDIILYQKFRLSADQKETLAQLGVGDEGSLKIEQDLRESLREAFRSITMLCFAVTALVVLISLVSTIVLIFDHHNGVVGWIWLTSWLAQVALAVFLYIVGRPQRQYLAFQLAFRALGLVGGALGTVPLSSQRIKLAKAITACSWQIRKFAPIAPVTMHSRIARKCAVHARRQSQALVYPALLGDDEKLHAVKSALGMIVVEIGKSRWMDIQRVHTHAEEYEKILISPSFITPGQLATIAVVILTAVPAIPTLAGYF